MLLFDYLKKINKNQTNHTKPQTAHNNINSSSRKNLMIVTEADYPVPLTGFFH